MAPSYLWRIEHGASAATELAVVSDAMLWQTGIQRHLQHSPLTTVLAWDATRMALYWMTRGCPQCPTPQRLCVPGCHTANLRRCLTVSAPRVQLHPVPHGLAPAAWSTLLIARPTRATVVPPPNWWRQWSAGRWVVQWSWDRRRGLQAGAWLMLADRTPAPHAALRDQGWQSLSLTWLRTLFHPLVCRPLPLATRWLGRWPGIPSGDTLCPVMPDLAYRTTATDMCDSVATDDAALAQWLQAALDQAHAASDQQEPELPVVLARAEGPEESLPVVPPGPAGMTMTQVAHVLEHMVTHAPFVAADQSSQVGVTAGRLSHLPFVTKTQARALMVWFDAAGILHDPGQEAQRWRAPRALCSHVVAELLPHLSATALPSPAQVEHHYMGTG